jgi:hypothetical protein
MLRNFILQPDEVKRVQFEGKWLIVTQATGPMELSIGGTTPIIVDEKDRVHLRDISPNDRAIRIKNISGAVNTIELHTSDLLVDKRTAVDLKNAIEIAPDQIIGIDQNANIVQAIIQNAICIDEKCNTVQVAPESWRYIALPTVIFEQKQDDQGNDLPIEPITIKGSYKRRELLLTAANDNTGPIWLGGKENAGTPLQAGESRTLNTNYHIDVLGDAGDWVYLAEMVKR